MWNIAKQRPTTVGNMEQKDKADVSDLRQLYNFLTAFKEQTIAEVALKVSKRRNTEFVIKFRDGFREDVLPRYQRDTAAMQFLPSTLMMFYLFILVLNQRIENFNVSTSRVWSKNPFLK